MAITMAIMAIISISCPRSRRRRAEDDVDTFLGAAAPRFMTLSIVLDPPPTSDGAYVAGLPLSWSVHVRSAVVMAMAPQALHADACLSGKEWSRVRYTELWRYIDSRGDRRTRRVTRYCHAERRIVHMPIDLGWTHVSRRPGGERSIHWTSCWQRR
jgi:hypothetical protein